MLNANGAWRAALIDALLPQRCILCGARADATQWCRGCLCDLPGAERERCPVCAIAVPGGLRCGPCVKRPPAFTRSVVAVDYAFPVDALIGRLKYGRDLTLIAPLAALLVAKAAAEPAPDIVVPMPMSEGRLRERGFNQAVEIARAVSRRLRMPLAATGAQRLRDAPPQASLPLAQRGANVRGAFACSAALAGRRVVLVDDVMTSGASLHELALTLRRAGAAEVSCWVVARTPEPGTSSRRLKVEG